MVRVLKHRQTSSRWGALMGGERLGDGNTADRSPHAQAHSQIQLCIFGSVAGDKCCSAHWHLSWFCQDSGRPQL